MAKILIFEPSNDNCERLEKSVRYQLDGMGLRHLEFVYFRPEDVFTKQMPETAGAAFFTLNSMYDVEAARKFNRIRKAIPVVVISDKTEYGVESWQFGTVYYLKRPYPEEEISMALRKCERGNNRYQYMKSY